MAKNHITLEGYIRKIELRSANTGTPILSIKVPIDRRKLDKQTNEWTTENTTWWELTTFGEDAEHQANNLKDGDYISFTGMPELQKSTSKDGREFYNAVMKFPDIFVRVKAPRESGQQQGGFRQRPAQQPQGDPWGGQSGQGQYDWSAGQGENPTF